MKISGINGYSQVFCQKTTQNKQLNYINHTTKTKPSFQAGNKNFNLMLVDTQQEPFISFEVQVTQPFSHKQGVVPLFELAMHDKMQKIQQANKNLKQNNFFYDGRIIKTEISCNPENINTIFSNAKKNYIDFKFTQDELEKAKSFASKAYALQNADYYYRGVDFDDTPKGLSTEDYKNFLKTISLDDLQKYSDDRLKNSDINIVLITDKNSLKNYNNILKQHSANMIQTI